ncbi:MAG: MBL fold metallo-hydrolase [Treponema sp.]|nr:MBL fold metallo-hydrolase [Treponema sp.]
MKIGGVVLLSVAALVIFSRCATQPEFDEEAWYRQTQAADPALVYAPHENPDGTFFNPWLLRSDQPRRSGFRNWFFRSKMRFGDFPEDNYAHRENDYSYLGDRGFHSVSFAGHASVIIKMDGETVFTDPFFSDRAVIIGKKVKIKFDFSKVPERPVVVISHNHYDHLDRYSVKALIKKDALFVAPLRLGKFFTDLGAKEVHELDWWESVRIGALTYTLLPAQHWSRRITQGRNRTLWGSYIIQGSKTVYFSGDTGYFRGFEEIGKRYDIDYALLGVGAYEPRWFMHYMHMNVPEFFRAAGDLRAKIAIPMHFGVISLSDEPLVYPLYEIDEFIKRNPACAERIRSLRVGEYLRIEAD